MTETIKTWRAEPLTWGRGPRQFEVFLEPTCPYSARAFAKLDETLAAAGSDNVTLKIRLHSQPWHMYSGVIVRCVLAASTLPTGKEAAKAVLGPLPRIARSSNSLNIAVARIWTPRQNKL